MLPAAHTATGRAVSHVDERLAELGRGGRGRAGQAFRVVLAALAVHGFWRRKWGTFLAISILRSDRGSSDQRTVPICYALRAKLCRQN